MRCWTVTACALLTLGAAAALPAEVRSARTAQCRAMCLDEYHVGETAPHTECLQNMLCLTCWEKCSSLHHALDAKFSACNQLPDCADAGCQRACQFHVSPPPAPRQLAATAPRLEVSFGGSEARWTMTEAGARRGNVVFLLLARTDDGWKELVQTPEASVVLINVRRGTPLRLAAMTQHGQLSAVEAEFRPTAPNRLVLDVERSRLESAAGRADLQTYQIEIPGAWLLETVSVARDDNMVLAEVSWEPQADGPAEYLVTWEVSGGGIKGHLYTDMTSVTLSLWPEAVYNIQVELMAPESLRSVPLVISTYSVAAGGHQDSPQAQQSVPRRLALPPALQTTLMGLALLALLAALGMSARALWRCGARRPTPPAGARAVFAVAECVKPKTVTSPLEALHAPPPPV